MDAERAVLGALLVQNMALASVRPIIDADDFYRNAHRLIFASMVALQGRNSAIDFITLKDELGRRHQLDEVGGPAYLASLVDGMPRSANVEHYARLVQDRSSRRATIASFRRAIALAYDGDLVDVQAEIARWANGPSARGPHGGYSSVSVPELLRRGTGKRTHLLGELIAVNEIAMLHGQPRDGKTWVSLEVSIALALGISAFGLPELTPARPGAVLIIGNEDAEAAYVDRVAQMCRGRGLDPSTLARLHFMVRVGASLDDPTWQARITSEAIRLGVVLIVFDSLRSVTARSDQGPSEFQPVALFLRSLMTSTGASILIVHHDTKPQPGVVDRRRLAQRASGGGIFSNVDAPIHVVGLGRQRTLLTPEGFKHAADPPPLVFARLHDTDAVRLVAELTTATCSAGVELHAKILDFVANTPGASGSKIAQGVRANKEATLGALSALRDAGKLESLDAGRAVKWMPVGPAKAR